MFSLILFAWTRPNIANLDWVWTMLLNVRFIIKLTNKSRNANVVIFLHVVSTRAQKCYYTREYENCRSGTDKNSAGPTNIFNLSVRRTDKKNHIILHWCYSGPIKNRPDRHNIGLWWFSHSLLYPVKQRDMGLYWPSCIDELFKFMGDPRSLTF